MSEAFTPRRVGIVLGRVFIEDRDADLRNTQEGVHDCSRLVEISAIQLLQAKKTARLGPHPLSMPVAPRMQG